MRAWGRVYREDGTYYWTEVATDANGINDYVYVTAYIQCLKLNLGESPMFGSAGIPAYPSVMTQVAPDYYTMLTQQRYAPYFLSLVTTRVSDAVDAKGRPVPTYRVSITTHYGVQVETVVPI
jgi:hypothetical protein